MTLDNPLKFSEFVFSFFFNLCTRVNLLESFDADGGPSEGDT